MAGMRIESNGHVIIHVNDDERATSWRVRAKWGPEISQWQFVKPMPEVDEMLEILEQASRPAPVAVPKIARRTKIVDPLDAKPVRPESEIAVKNS